MKLMINGVWQGDVASRLKSLEQEMIHSGHFRSRITTDGSSEFPAERGRYHLYVSYACPFAHRTLIAHSLKRLRGIVHVSVLQPLWDTHDGWQFDAQKDGASDQEPGRNKFHFLHEAYRTARPDYTGKVTVPVLWDNVSSQIVNNESIEIAHMFNDVFDALGADSTVDFYPARLRPKIDQLNAQIIRCLSKGVYAVGQAGNQSEYRLAADVLFDFMDELETVLADGRRFLLGDVVTLADILAFTPLVRFDAVYHPLFRASRKRLVDYRHLPRFIRQLHALPDIGQTVRFDHILSHYNDGDWAVATRRGIVPDEPAYDFRRTGSKCAHSFGTP